MKRSHVPTLSDTGTAAIVGVLYAGALLAMLSTSLFA